MNSEPSMRRLVFFTETILHYMSTLWDQIIYMYKAEAWKVDRSIRNVYKIKKFSRCDIGEKNKRNRTGSRCP
jgi:hypothetical protein